jgi:hypothetical protein
LRDADAGDCALRYRLQLAVDRRYPERHLDFNPHRVWELTPA